MAESKLGDIISTSLEKIKEFTNSETVVGEPITVGTTTIIPVSKITMGFASGGVDYSTKKAHKEPSAPPSKPHNFGGGGGTGVNITPIAFLVISEDGRTEILPITGYEENGSVDKITSLIERSPEILERLKGVFSRKKKSGPDTEKSSDDADEGDPA